MVLVPFILPSSHRALPESRPLAERVAGVGDAGILLIVGWFGMSRACKYRHHPAQSGLLLDDLYTYADAPDIPRGHNLSGRTVADGRPDPVPVTDAGVAVFEAWFKQELDALLSEDDADLA